MIAAPPNGKTFPDTVSYEHKLVTVCEGNGVDNIKKSLVFGVSAYVLPAAWSPGKLVELNLSRLWGGPCFHDPNPPSLLSTWMPPASSDAHYRFGQRLPLGLDFEIPCGSAASLRGILGAAL